MLSPEQSIAIHSGNWAIRKQLLVKSPKANNNNTDLLFGTSIFDIKSELPDDTAIETVKGIRILPLPNTLIQCSPSMFVRSSIDTRTALAQIRDALMDAMPAFFELLEEEPEASVRTLLGHFIFVYIHPYMDGNGRMARFLMNMMLASGGYPWIIIEVKERKVYMQALEAASVRHNIKGLRPFRRFLVIPSIHREW